MEEEIETEKPMKHTIRIIKKVEAITLEFDTEGNFLGIAIEYE